MVDGRSISVTIRSSNLRQMYRRRCHGILCDHMRPDFFNSRVLFAAPEYQRNYQMKHVAKCLCLTHIVVEQFKAEGKTFRVGESVPFVLAKDLIDDGFGQYLREDKDPLPSLFCLAGVEI